MFNKTVRRARSAAKTTAATAIGTFVIANPLLAAFGLGVGVALWWALRRHGTAA